MALTLIFHKLSTVISPFFFLTLLQFKPFKDMWIILVKIFPFFSGLPENLGSYTILKTEFDLNMSIMKKGVFCFCGFLHD